MNKNTTVNLCFVDILALIFITLKLCHIIAWSWWLVLLPVYSSIIVGAIREAFKKKTKGEI